MVAGLLDRTTATLRWTLGPQRQGKKNYHQYFGEPFVSEGAIGLLRELGRKLTRNEPVAAHRQHVSTLHTSSQIVPIGHDDADKPKTLEACQLNVKKRTCYERRAVDEAGGTS